MGGLARGSSGQSDQAVIEKLGTRFDGCRVQVGGERVGGVVDCGLVCKTDADKKLQLLKALSWANVWGCLQISGSPGEIGMKSWELGRSNERVIRNHM